MNYFNSTPVPKPTDVVILTMPPTRVDIY